MKAPQSAAAVLGVLMALPCCCEPVFAQRSQADVERFYAQSQLGRETSDSPEVRPFSLLRSDQSAPVLPRDPTRRNTDDTEALSRATNFVSGYHHPLVPPPRSYVGGATWATLEQVQVERMKTVRLPPVAQPARSPYQLQLVTVIRPLAAEKIRPDKPEIEKPNIVRPSFDRVERQGGGQASLDRIMRGVPKDLLGDQRLTPEQRQVNNPGASIGSR